MADAERFRGDNWFNEDMTMHENFPATWWPYFFQRTRTIFKHNRAIIEKNVRTTFDEDWNINMTSTGLTNKTSPPLAAMLLKKTTHVLTKFYHSHLTISAPPSGDHVCQLTIFKLS
ncbi:hypothetical protein DPMN_002875 [Dreissena polymorpha]|uniref:Uncharacterized protein n=1 Tax=Dreissena polymorpha TaxID=45954 RepID=A0A9D4MN57_DREPO|nr:hypothetical protein DPMN_002875 [Dreissena polymorpha]